MQAAALGQSTRIEEASGVARSGNALLVVDDSQQGVYFRVKLPKEPGGLIDLNAAKPERVRVRQAGLAVDLESIGVLADGRVALLSERLRSLVSEDGVIAEYDSRMAEVAKRGLEGLAARGLSNGASRVAVLWEGGYPDAASLPEILKGPSGTRALSPLVLIHDVPRNGKVSRVASAGRTFELGVPRPQGTEPRAQRFRAPDLIWTRLQSGDWGLIALLSSQNGAGPIRYGFLWLQRFDLRGRRIGEPMDLRKQMPAEVREANWEGLAWWEEGRSVVLVHEEDNENSAHAFFTALPPEWQFGPTARDGTPSANPGGRQ